MLGKELVGKMTIFEYKFTISYQNTDIIQTVKTGSFSHYFLFIKRTINLLLFRSNFRQALVDVCSCYISSTYSS